MPTSFAGLGFAYLLLLIPTVGAAQSRADTIEIARVTVAEFSRRRPVFIDVRQGITGHLHDGGRPRDSVWVASVALGPGVAGVCDAIACKPTRPDDFRVIRLSDPRFTAPDIAQTFVVLTVGGGAAGCRDEDRIGYDVTLVRNDDKWVVRARRENRQAWVAESLCAVRSQKRP